MYKCKRNDQTLEFEANVGSHSFGKPSRFIKRSSGERMEDNVIHHPEPRVGSRVQFQVYCLKCGFGHGNDGLLQRAVHGLACAVMDNVGHESVPDAVVSPILKLIHDDGLRVEAGCPFDGVKYGAVS